MVRRKHSSECVCPVNYKLLRDFRHYKGKYASPEERRSQRTAFDNVEAYIKIIGTSLQQAYEDQGDVTDAFKEELGLSIAHLGILTAIEVIVPGTGKEGLEAEFSVKSLKRGEVKRRVHQRLFQED